MFVFRRMAARKRSFSPNSRTEGQENPMYENLIDIEQDHGGDLSVLNPYHTILSLNDPKVEDH